MAEMAAFEQVRTAIVARPIDTREGPTTSCQASGHAQDEHESGIAFYDAVEKYCAGFHCSMVFAALQ